MPDYATDTLRTSTPAGGFDGTMQITGELGSSNFRACYKLDHLEKANVSPWHDVRLQTALYGTYNAVITNPRGSSAVMGLALQEDYTPIAPSPDQESFKSPAPFNIGFLPGTWASPNAEKPGDGLPVGVVDIGSTTVSLGDVVPIKPLGIMAVTKNGKVSYKVICMNVAEQIVYDLSRKGMDAVNEKFPGVIDEMCKFFVEDGATSEIKGFVDAESTISICFDHWRGLRDGSEKNEGGIWTKTVTAWTDGL